MTDLKFSKQTEEAIRDCRLLAERYRNNFISGQHFYLIYPKYRTQAHDPVVPYFYKKAFVNYLLQSKSDNFNKEANLRLTVHFEKALHYAGFHRWLLRSLKTEPIHLFFSLIETSEDSRTEYEKYFKTIGIQLSGIRKLAFHLYHNPFIRKTGLVRLFK